jgi:hypothetical protein
MKRLAIAHLSDVHLGSKQDDDSVLRRASAIGAAIAAETEGCPTIVIALTGDLAFSGKPEQYESGRRFLSEIEAAIAARAPRTKRHVMIVPGNHDCDFDRASSVRAAVQGTLATVAVDDAMVDVCTAVQEPFMTAFDVWRGRAGLARLATVQELEADDTRVSFLLLNTAWASSKKEKQGTLTFPVDYIPNVSGDDIVIGMMHHSLNWLESTNARRLREQLESRCDVVLTGHEHEQGAFSTVRHGNRSRSNSESVEGGVLQEPGGAQSTFNVVTVDTDSKRLRVAHCVLQPSGIYRAESEPTWRDFARNSARLRDRFVFTPEFEEELDDLGMALAHPRKLQLRLSDIYEFPYFRGGEGRGKKPKLLRQSDVTAHMDAHSRIMIIGPDKAGKSALCKRLCHWHHHNGLVPVLLNGSSLVRTEKRLDGTLRAAVERQYGSAWDAFRQLEHKRKVIVIDDWHQVRGGAETKTAIIEFLSARCEKLVLVGSELSRVLEASEAAESGEMEFSKLELLKFPPSLRSALIRRWVTLGADDVADARAAEASLVQIERSIGVVVASGRIPSHPANILILLQALRAKSELARADGSFGFMYESVITDYLALASGTRAGMDTKYNYLAEFAYECYANSVVSLSDSETAEWHREFCDRYKINLEFDALRNDFVSARILRTERGRVSFKYPYFFHYFVARYFRDHLSEEPVRTEVASLAGKLHNDRVAEVLLFLCHLSKDAFILESVLSAAKSIFSDSTPATLSVEPHFIADIAGPSMFSRLSDSPRGNRQSLLEAQDDFELSHDEPDEWPDDTQESAPPPLGSLTSQAVLAFKSINILGQVLRNFPGSLRGELKLRLTLECYSLGMRLLSALFKELETRSDDLAGAAVEAIRKSSPEASPAQLRERAKAMVAVMVELLTHAVIRHVSDSVALDTLARTFEEALGTAPTIANRMIDVCVKLDAGQEFPEAEVKNLVRDSRKNRFAFRVLQQMVWMHFQSFQEDYRLRQQMCGLLEIELPTRPGLPS